MQNRSRAFDLLDILLSDKLNFVTIQLDENVTDVSTLRKNLKRLLHMSLGVRQGTRLS